MTDETQAAQTDASPRAAAHLEGREPNPNTPLYGRGGEIAYRLQLCLGEAQAAGKSLEEQVDLLLDVAALSHPCREVTEAVRDLEEIQLAVFGTAGSEPDVYADHDRLSDLSGKMRRALAALSSPLEDKGLVRSATPSREGSTEPATASSSEPLADETDTDHRPLSEAVADLRAVTAEHCPNLYAEITADLAAEDLAARRAAAYPALLEALELILPLAKGYASAHPVGSNRDYVNNAEFVAYTFRRDLSAASSDTATGAVSGRQPSVETANQAPLPSAVSEPSGEMVLTHDERDLMRHALGLNRTPKPHRNNFCAGDDHEDMGTINALIAKGFMGLMHRINGGRDGIYYVTELGKSALSAAPSEPERGAP